MISQQGWTYPALWKRYLLQHYPASSAVSATRMGRIKQMHSMRRGADGTFNQLWHGKPDFHPEFERALEKAVEDMREEGLIRNVALPHNPMAEVSGQEVFAAIASLKEEHGELYEVLAYFQTPPRLRRHDVSVFAHLHGCSKNTLYRWLHYATLAVWLYLPPIEREKFVPTWHKEEL